VFISDFSIRRPIITIVSMLALVVFGIFALFSLNTDEFPDVAPPVVSVSIPYPGAAPETVEREVVEPAVPGQALRPVRPLTAPGAGASLGDDVAALENAHARASLCQALEPQATPQVTRIQ